MYNNHWVSPFTSCFSSNVSPSDPPTLRTGRTRSSGVHPQGVARQVRGDQGSHHLRQGRRSVEHPSEAANSNRWSIRQPPFFWGHLCNLRVNESDWLWGLDSHHLRFGRLDWTDVARWHREHQWRLRSFDGRVVVDKGRRTES